MGLKEAFRKVGQAIEETKQKDNKGRMVWQIWSRKRKRMKKPS